MGSGLGSENWPGEALTPQPRRSLAALHLLCFQGFCLDSVRSRPRLPWQLLSSRVHPLSWGGLGAQQALAGG